MGVELNLPRYMGNKVSLGPTSCWAKWQGDNGSMQSLFHNWAKGKISCPQTYWVEKTQWHADV